MSGPYTANSDGGIGYIGNKIFEPISDVRSFEYSSTEVQRRAAQFRQNPMWSRIARINHRINWSANGYFDAIHALYTPLPAASSSGSSPICLELALLQHGIEHVYAIHDAFWAKEADPTHLPELHRVDYEGRVAQQRNVEIATALTRCLVHDLLAHNEEDLAYFLTPRRLNQLSNMADSLKNIQFVPFQQALCLLHHRTRHDKYRCPSTKTFGAWDEIALTEIVGGATVVTQFPLMDVPFYQARVDGVEPSVADTAAFLWPGYREYLGSGHRVRSKAELEQRVEAADLHRGEYRPYLQSRESPEYVETSGFSLGWERFLHGLLHMPFIWSASQFPQGDATLAP